jgi:predicted RNA binding protein YcfA (HicA-like mRNA interferase family)
MGLAVNRLSILTASALQTLHQLEEELHLEILPGTEIMADVGSHHFVKSKASPDRVLVPQPSEDSHDPLVRSYQGKPPFFIRLLTISSGDRIGLRCGRLRPSSVFCSRHSPTFTQGFGPLALAPMFGDLIEEFHSSLADVIQFTGVCILVLGFSNLL